LDDPEGRGRREAKSCWRPPEREFEEETSLRPDGPFEPLGSITQKAGKVVHAWAFEGDCDPAGGPQQYI
jgi:predicted NUDIX family NTP pyrophosphohydrolase